MINPKFPGPWVLKEQEKAQARMPVLKDISDPDEETVEVRFLGRGKAIWVRAPKEEKKDVTETAAGILGKTIREILLLPGAKATFDKESIGFEAPLGPRITLSLGVPFFAAISTTNTEVAYKMTLDRIVCAISAVRATNFEKVQHILQKNQVELVTK